MLFFAGGIVGVAVVEGYTALNAVHMMIISGFIDHHIFVLCVCGAVGFNIIGRRHRYRRWPWWSVCCRTFLHQNRHNDLISGVYFVPSSTDHANAVVGSIATIMRTARSAESSLVLLDLRIAFISYFIPFVLIKKSPPLFSRGLRPVFGCRYANTK